MVAGHRVMSGAAANSSVIEPGISSGGRRGILTTTEGAASKSRHAA
jgi:hypothetical protein